MPRRWRPKPNGRAHEAAGLFDELLIDNFAGGGGASLGIEAALGRAVDYAINHDREAVALHMRNHPHTVHLCEDVWDVDPATIAKGRPVGLCWFSPDCKHFSRAKGGRPVEKNIRSLAWVVVRWAAKVKPRLIFLENVREFKTWGPLKNGKPCPKRKGKTFRRWVSCLETLGYRVQWRILDAADFGAPTHRKRLFLVARCDGRPIAWPEPTHGPGRPWPYRTAAECLDWRLPCPSIFLSREEGRAVGVNRPLAPKTMRRIAMGLRRFVIDNAKPFIVRCDHGGDHFRGQSVDAPLRTVTQSHGYGLVAPFLTQQNGEAPHQETRGQAADKPLLTITPRIGGGLPLVAAHISKFFGGVVGQPADQPLPTVTAIDHNAIVAANLVQYNGEKTPGEARGQVVDKPINAITADPRFALAATSLVRIGQAGGNGAYVNGVSEPLTTIVSKAEHCITAAYLSTHYGDRPDGSSQNGHSVEEPAPTITGRGTQNQLAAAYLSKFYGTSIGSEAGEPVPTIMGQGNHIAEVRAFLTKFYGARSVGQVPGEPLHSVMPHNHFGVVTVDGQPHQIVDIGLRMLTPRELYTCQGFPPSYQIEVDVPAGRYRGIRLEIGDQTLEMRQGKLFADDPTVTLRPLPKSAQVRMCGNSVSPPVAAALVRANMAEAETGVA